ncbi:hypothetical protein LSAT2_011289 [Lamellibrachia satsuma]|nr:hypothetical protein LSAT2_011289 [Lamellibrachia satsuma]
MALAGAAVNDSNVRNLQDMLLTYNKITEACFNKCVSNMNYRDLTDREDWWELLASISVQHRFVSVDVNLLLYFPPVPVLLMV